MKTLRHVEILECIYDTEEERKRHVKLMELKGYFVGNKECYNISQDIYNPKYAPYAYFEKCEN